MKPDEQDAVVERLLDGLQPSSPPPELRSSVLATARQRMGTETAPDIWSRLWNHSGLRLAWAASVVLLLAGHVLVNTGQGTATDPDLYAENRVDEYLVEMLRPTRISDNVRPIVGFNVDSNGLTDLELEGNPS
jgi:hypothetical protein